MGIPGFPPFGWQVFVNASTIRNEPVSNRPRSARDWSSIKTTKPAAQPSIQSIDDLMQLYDRTFLQAAYPVMLRRAADLTGVEYYLRRMRRGYSRIAVLDQLWKSDEANPRWEVHGLRPRLERFRRQKRGWRGLWRRWTDPEFGMRFQLRQARAIENAIGGARHDMLAACAELASEQQQQNELLTMLLRRVSELPTQGGRSGGRTRKAPGAHTVYDVRESDLPPSALDALKTLRL